MYGHIKLTFRVTLSSASSLLLSARADQKTALSPSFSKCLAHSRLCCLVSRSALFTSSMFTLSFDTSFTYDSWQQTKKDITQSMEHMRDRKAAAEKKRQHKVNENSTQWLTVLLIVLICITIQKKYSYQVRTSEQQRISGINNLNDNITKWKQKANLVLSTCWQRRRTHFNWQL